MLSLSFNYFYKHTYRHVQNDTWCLLIFIVFGIQKKNTKLGLMNVISVSYKDYKYFL